ncbi:DNRLRE domain-containing protein [Cohnella sp. CFH 77786]|uniref:CBM96 family carbohydrate-binding protein n=1 Tax=Cohnella sp. CFH 77786 TaxID=2662265 RepID=UPI001C60F396|nr:DNRLRE domain-containing protein [Cohnella sp. CFH 77786]MBW5445712.1 DNRLRE domain-containing protein [Cohnella sp. CFH 77786]
MRIRSAIRRIGLLMSMFALLFSTAIMVPAWIDDAHADGTSYYVDSVSGNDSYDGLSSATPWKSLNKVNAATFQPGDRILFKSGSVWNGQLRPKGSGAVIGGIASPIVIDRYGTGNKPIINGNGLIGGTIHLYNQQYWEINNLEVTNRDPGLVPGNRQGVYIQGQDAGTLNHIRIRGLYVHDVTGQNTNDMKITGGIFVVVTGTAVRTNWNDVLIEGNTVERVDRSGICTYSSWGINGSASFAPFTNVAIRNNALHDIGGDGIVLRSSDYGVVEYNVVSKAHARDTHYDVAIWAINSNHPVIQFNEAYDTQTTMDGQGFDCDYNNRGCTIQYNYSHDNRGGFVLIMGTTFNDDVVVRYNISQGDRERLFEMNQGYVPRNAQIYNNTIYVPSTLSVKFNEQSSGSNGNVYLFRNNIIHSAGSLTYGPGDMSFDSNLFSGNHSPTEPADPRKITSDPQFVCGGCGGTGRDSVGGYRLYQDSPALGSGVPIAGNGGRDYWGNSVSATGAPNRGAYNGPGVERSDPSLPPRTWTASDDATVRDGSYADTNQSGATTPSVETKADAVSYAREGYYKFDFGGFTGTVNEATVILTPLSAGTSGIQNQVAFVSDNTWTEGGITWNTKPASGAVLGTYTVTPGVPIRIDVTSQVRAAMSGDKKISIRVFCTSPAGSRPLVSYGSSEHSDAQVLPVLQIDP